VRVTRATPKAAAQKLAAAAAGQSGGREAGADIRAILPIRHRAVRNTPAAPTLEIADG
jgi:hypothetical protein